MNTALHHTSAVETPEQSLGWILSTSQAASHSLARSVGNKPPQCSKCAHSLDETHNDPQTFCSSTAQLMGLCIHCVGIAGPRPRPCLCQTCRTRSTRQSQATPARHTGQNEALIASERRGCTPSDKSPSGYFHIVCCQRSLLAETSKNERQILGSHQQARPRAAINQ